MIMTIDTITGEEKVWDEELRDSEEFCWMEANKGDMKETGTLKITRNKNIITIKAEGCFRPLDDKEKPWEDYEFIRLDLNGLKDLG